jgi:hypothetical protein
MEQPHASVMAHSVTWEDACLVALHNLTGEPVSVPLKMPDLDPGTKLVDLLCDGQHALDDKGRPRCRWRPTASGGCASCVPTTDGSCERGLRAGPRDAGAGVPRAVRASEGDAVSEDCARGPATEERVSRELFERAKATL